MFVFRGRESLGRIIPSQGDHERCACASQMILVRTLSKEPFLSRLPHRVASIQMSLPAPSILDHRLFL
jgi:hypothetical protein